MALLRLEIDVDYDPDVLHGSDPDALAWFRDKVLVSPDAGEELILHSNCIGDSIGTIRRCVVRGGPFFAADTVSRQESCHNGRMHSVIGPCWCGANDEFRGGCKPSSGTACSASGSEGK